MKSKEPKTLTRATFSCNGCSDVFCIVTCDDATLQAITNTILIIAKLQHSQECPAGGQSFNIHGEKVPALSPHKVAVATATQLPAFLRRNGG